MDSRIQVSCSKPANAFYLSASVCFLLLAVLLLFSMDAFSGHYFQPKLLAVTHLAALGWGTLLILGICCQTLPVIFKTDSFNPKLLWAVLALFLSGLTLLVYSFWAFLPGLPMQWGSILLLTGILIFAIQVFLSAAKSRASDLQQEYITTAFVWLAVTALLGVVMVFNFRFAFLPKDHLVYLRIHAHTGIAGWFLMLIIGLNNGSYFADNNADNKLLSAAYYLINIALLLFLADAYFYGINLKTYAVLLIGLTGLAACLIFLFRNFRQKRAEVFSMLSIFLLLLAAVLVPFIIHYSLKSEPSAIRLTTLYGALILMGWITAYILGYTLKNYITYSAKGFKTLYSVVFVLFCLTFFLGLFLNNKPLQIFGLACLLAVSCLHLVKVILVLAKEEGKR